ncbi:hypothetical protein C5167_016592 [Papaver somniferum]|nr:hypothetical protein C5167_016592 [Papaver somniferum]
MTPLYMTEARQTSKIIVEFLIIWNWVRDEWRVGTFSAAIKTSSWLASLQTQCMIITPANKLER